MKKSHSSLDQNTGAVAPLIENVRLMCGPTRAAIGCMMTRHTFHPLRALLIPAVLLPWSLPAQQNTAPAQQPVVFRVEVVGRTTKAINYHHRQGSTEVAFEGTSLAPRAKGVVRVDSKTGATKIDAYIDKMPPATSIGDGYLTYVLWAITPEGRAQNMGELMIDGDDARLQAATELQTFGMIVTAEPYYAVTQPSDYVVAEAIVKSGSTTGTVMPIETKYELVAKGGYLAQLPPGDRVRLREARNIPIDLMEARQAVAIAKAAGADHYAADTMRKAEVDLRNAESFLMSGGDKKKIQTLARHVTQLGEDARLIAVRKAHDEALAAERASLEKTAQDEQDRRRRAETDAAAQTRAAALAEEQAAAARRRELLNQQQTAALVAEKERQMALERERAAQAALRQAESQAEADRARREEARVREDALARQRSLEAETARAREAADRAEAERAKMRAELVRQLNVVLATRETARGLIVNMSDVLFDTGLHTLRPGAREKLARISGIILAHPDMRIEVEGHTDSVGGVDLNQRLSEKRADSVRTYLISQGVDSNSIVARGFGKSKPVADNATAAGRQQNRRVELVVNGPLIDKTSSNNGGVSQ
jgi:outer membrane protein OmpA-like peptidoglycan-associated protein